MELKAASQRAAAVVVVDLEAERTGGEKTARDCEHTGAVKSVFLGCDVSDGAAVDAVVREAVRQFGRLDCVFANAGVNGAGTAGGWAHEVPDANFARLLAVNLGGVFHTAKYSLPHLVASGGALVNTASSFGMVGAHYNAAYGAAKGGVINLTRSLAKDYGPLGVRVNAICPGYIHNAMGRSVPNVADGALPPPELARASQLSSLTPEGVEAAWANREAAASMQVRPR